MTKIKYIKHAIFLMILAFAASCTEIIEIDVGETAASRLVIYGHISNEAGPHSIRITRSVGFSYSSVAVRGATVTITDCEGNIFELKENQQEPGIYQTSEDFTGIEGKTYTLEVNIDGQEYSAEATMPFMQDIDFLEFRAPVTHIDWFNENFMEVRVHIEDVEKLPEENYYTVFVSHNDSALNSTIDRFSIVYSLEMDMPFILFRLYSEDEQPRERNNDDEDEEVTRIRLRPGDIVTVKINAISLEYATFISTAQTELSGSIPIFSGPPANVRSNIDYGGQKNQVLGFFTAFSSREAEVTYELTEIE